MSLKKSEKSCRDYIFGESLLKGIQQFALSCTHEKDRSTYVNNETKEMEREIARFLLTQNWLLLVTTTSFTILAGFSVGVVVLLF